MQSFTYYRVTVMLLLAAIILTVSQVVAPPPSTCYACDENNENTCILNQQQQLCAYPLETHCSSAKLKIRNTALNGLEEFRFVRGCIDCQDKKSACDLLAGNLKTRGMTVLECEIDCCNNGSLCNDGAAHRPKCWSCTLEGAGSNCAAGQQRQICDIDPESLGTTHCGSAAGRKRNQYGVIQNFFYRGCFDCAKKREACFALGGYWKGDLDNRGATTLLECDLECCDVSGINGSYCNVHTPELKPAAVTVFTPTVTGPAQCNVCLERDATSCSDNQEIQVCGVDPYSLGTTHCGSAVGTYRDSKGDIVHGFFRGCINCADKKAACAAIGGFRKNVQKWTQLECKIECCTGDNCNTQKPSLLKLKSNKALRTDFHQILLSAVLAFYIAVALNIVN
ncbi:uncharacterized skeletal organic matrix protein 2-like isoform X1 [Montipora capricornis]|uniref:uncharacterized skeletal organic matrix protein 2-like isoform X1 n=1 Tax=Montipora capricornis TaxID=246305 RepID=UPI0035F1D47A